MKSIVLLTALTLCAGLASAQVYVKPHVTRDGAYVEGYQRTAPNSTKTDNYSSQGNTNPYTGQQGHVDPYAPANTSPQANPYITPNPYRVPRP